MFRLFILLFLLPAVTFSQKSYTIRSFSTENGMPSNGIKGVQWDETTGFLWIATEAGVVRFNGIDFKNFTSQNTPGLLSERMAFLTRNYHGKVVTADQERNVFRIEKNRMVFENNYPIKKEETTNLFLISTSEILVRNNMHKPTRLVYFLPFDKVVPLNDTSCYLRKANEVYFYSLHQERKIAFEGITKGVKSVFKIGKSFFV